MNIAICDDDKCFVESLYKNIFDILVQYDYDIIDFQIYKYNSPKALMYQCFHDSSYSNIDILFLDISMPEIDGFDVARICYEQFPETLIIFISDCKELVYQSLHYSPFRFLCKKTYTEHLKEALNSAIEKKLKIINYITVKSDGLLIPVKIKKIIFAEKEKTTNYINIHSTDNNYKYRKTIHEFLEAVPESYFIKINSGIVVNMKYINSISADNLELFGGFRLKISRAQKSEVKKAYTNFLKIDRA